MRGRIIAAASPPILVTGAIGALAAAILSRRGFQVTASAGGAEEADGLKKRERGAIIESREARRTRETIGK